MSCEPKISYKQCPNFPKNASKNTKHFENQIKTLQNTEIIPTHFNRPTYPKNSPITIQDLEKQDKTNKNIPKHSGNTNNHLKLAEKSPKMNFFSQNLRGDIFSSSHLLSDSHWVINWILVWVTYNGYSTRSYPTLQLSQFPSGNFLINANWE